MSGQYALMWSGGKDSALALARARAAGLAVTLLLSFHDSESGRVRFHATRVGMLRAQARALGLELRAVATTWPEMEKRLAVELKCLHSEGYTGVILGDIHLADVRAWYEERVTAAGLEHVEPIWHVPSGDLLAEFVGSGGRAVLTCVDLMKLDRSWLGRVIDERFLDDIRALPVDACGENGEYHTFVFSGPGFRTPLRWQAGEMVAENGFAQLDVLPA